MICYLVKRRGRRLWRGRYRVAGMRKPKEVPLGVSDKQVAERKLRDIVAEAEREAAGIIAPKSIRQAARCELVEHLAEYLADLKTQGMSAGYRANIDFRVRALIDQCGWRLPADVTPLSFIRWRQAATTQSTKTRNDYLAAIRSLLNWMINQQLLLANPLAGVRSEKSNGRKTRVRRAFRFEEILRLVAAVPFYRKALYITAVLTGIRRKELRALVWDLVKLEAGCPHIFLPEHVTKSGRNEVVPLHPDVVAVLTKLRPAGAAGGDRVFPWMPRIERFKRDLKKAGIEYRDEQGRVADFHALRKTFDTNLQTSGAQPRVTMELMRHSDPRQTMLTYTDASLLPTATAVRALPSYLDAAPMEATDGKTPGSVEAPTPGCPPPDPLPNPAHK